MHSASNENLALFLSTRQKRLKYWQETFSMPSFRPAVAQQVSEKLSTYRLLLSKVARATGEFERNESKERLISLDREITSLFERSRQATSGLKSDFGSETIVLKPR